MIFDLLQIKELEIQNRKKGFIYRGLKATSTIVFWIFFCDYLNNIEQYLNKIETCMTQVYHQYC